MNAKFIGAIAILALVSLLINRASTNHNVEADEYNPLTPEEARVILHEGTERAFSGEYDKHFESGVYACKRCDAPLFHSDSKFDSHSGWPSFDDIIPGAIRETPDGRQTEIECAICGGHIGHVFRGEGYTKKDTRHCANSIALNFVPEANVKRAIFAGGCFWGVEHYLRIEPGVLSTTVGYVGGRIANPTYKQVSYEDTGHAEAVEVVYDADKTSYETLARLFFEIHDPTQMNRQGPDIGDQYRSTVFYLDDEQRDTTEKLIGLLKDNGFNVVTTLTPAQTFWPAEDYHQDYYRNNGKQPYCHSRVERF